MILQPIQIISIYLGIKSEESVISSSAFTFDIVDGGGWVLKTIIVIRFLQTSQPDQHVNPFNKFIQDMEPLPFPQIESSGY